MVDQVFSVQPVPMPPSKAVGRNVSMKTINVGRTKNTIIQTSDGDVSRISWKWWRMRFASDILRAWSGETSALLVVIVCHLRRFVCPKKFGIGFRGNRMVQKVLILCVVVFQHISVIGMP